MKFRCRRRPPNHGRCPTILKTTSQRMSQPLGMWEWHDRTCENAGQGVCLLLRRTDQCDIGQPQDTPTRTMSGLRRGRESRRSRESSHPTGDKPSLLRAMLMETVDVVSVVGEKEWALRRTGKAGQDNPTPTLPIHPRSPLPRQSAAGARPNRPRTVLSGEAL